MPRKCLPAAMVRRHGLRYDRRMIGLGFLPHPLLAVALLVSACAGQSEAPIQDQPLPCADCSEEDAEYYWRAVGPGNTMFFDFDSAALRPDAAASVEYMVRWLNEFYPDTTLMIEGHTDDRGSREYNLELGCRRALAMIDALIGHGFAPERLGIVSYGEVRPAVLGANEAAWAQNRRAVYQMVDTITSSNCSGDIPAR